MILPSADLLLLSFINTKLRDDYSSIEDLCEDLDIDFAELTVRLKNAGYVYDAENNRFS